MTVTARITHVLALLAVVGCSRNVELRDDQASGFLPNNTAPLADGGIPLLGDAGFDDPSFQACTDRPEGDCRGANDFPCDFSGWFPTVVAECQEQLSCGASDWLSLELQDGCVTALGMVQPHPELIACLVQTFSAFHCPCMGHLQVKYYLGVASACSDAAAPGLR